MNTYIEKATKIFNQKAFQNANKHFTKAKETILSQESFSYAFYKIYKNQFNKFCVSVTSVSSSGLSRRMKISILTKKGEMIDITNFTAKVLDWKINDKGILVNGCGMDMCFHTLSSLTNTLFQGIAKKSKNYNSVIDKSNYYRTF